MYLTVRGECDLLVRDVSVRGECECENLKCECEA